MARVEVIFAPRAERDLHSIASYIARRNSPEVAERFGNRLIDRALTLATLPERGRIVPEFGDPEIREIFFKTYRIVYRVRPGKVEVIRFWHAARGAPEIDSDEFR
jgi:plasmid stabilization system protein ParE